MNLTDQEISVRRLSRVVAVRKYNHGRMPGMTGDEALKKVEEHEERFLHPNIELTKDEEINMFATALEIAVKFMFKHHVYSFGGKTYCQTDSGPIGLRITMAVARLVMGEWGEKMKAILTDADIKIFLSGLFVDDCRYLTSSLPDGVRWSQDEKKFVFRKEWKSEDCLQNKNQRTSQELCHAMNSIYSNIKFTIETESDFSNKRLPTLDFDLWVEEGNYLRYSFYEKPMKNPFCIMQQSAMSNKTKIQILSQDLVRRMLNVGDNVSQDERNKIVDDYTDRLIRSGYSEAQVRDIIVSGLTGYERKKTKAANEKAPLHRPAATTLNIRLHKKLTERENWFKNQKQKEQKATKTKNKHENETAVTIPVVSVMFTPFTPESQLLQKLRKVEAKVSSLTGDKIQHVERAGTKLRYLLVSSDPWSNVKCGSNKCLVCTNPYNTNFSCKKRNVSYKTYCLKCAEEAGADEKTLKTNVSQNIQFYFGETFRDASTRGTEHLADYLSQADDSHMFKHLSDTHPGLKDVKFGMTVVKQHKSSFQRQIFESVLIFRGKNVLNSKSEFSRCQVPRLSVLIGEDQQRADTKIEVMKLKRRFIENENFQPLSKKRRENKDVNELEVDSKTIDKTESTQEALDEQTNCPVPHDDGNLKFFQLFNSEAKQRDPKPTKRKSNLKRLKGQPKISNFLNTKVGKRFSADSPSPAPT